MLGELRPEVEVHGGEARGGDDAGHLEEGLTQGIPQGQRQRDDVGGDDQRGHGDNAQEAAHLLRTQGVADAPHQQEVVDVKVDAEKDHKDAQHNFHIGAAISGDARRGHGKAAGTCGAEGEAETVEEVHIAQKKQHHQYGGHGRVDAVEDHGGLLHAGHQLAGHGAWHLGAHQVHGVVVLHGDNHEYKHQHAHAADPVGEAAPEEDAVGQQLRLGQHRRAGGGEARDDFKERLEVGGELAA